MELVNCPLIGYKLKEGELKPIVSQTIEYQTEFVGEVRITVGAIRELEVKPENRYIFAGICKTRTINNLEPVLIDSSFVNGGFKAYDPPMQFDEKCFETIKTLYILIGKENKELQLNSTVHFALGFSDPEEFSRIIDQLESQHFISYRKKHQVGRIGSNIYMGFKVTNYGKEEARKGLPKIPLHGLVNQNIETGDYEIDKKINHAKKLFFSEPITMDNMRSACENLSFVLEPLREDMKQIFENKDVSDFFNIVNNFDIRHNKEKTKNIVYPEQLEWIFYSLLNSINTYVKLKRIQ